MTLRVSESSRIFVIIEGFVEFSIRASSRVISWRSRNLGIHEEWYIVTLVKTDPYFAYNVSRSQVLSFFVKRLVFDETRFSTSFFNIPVITFSSKKELFKWSASYVSPSSSDSESISCFSSRNDKIERLPSLRMTISRRQLMINCDCNLRSLVRRSSLTRVTEAFRSSSSGLSAINT